VTLVGVNPVGIGSLSVTVVPSVAPPLFDAVKLKLPVPPRTNLEALAVFEIVKSGEPAVPIVTEPLAGVESPPPLTVAVFVSEAAAVAATSTATEIAG
jgi:hypothetical protein